MAEELSNDRAMPAFANGDQYHASRPDYPRDAVAYLVLSLGIDSDAHVVDLGAGTGIFTEQLIGFGPRITAVEPTKGMREVLARRLPSVAVMNGSDVNIPLDSDSIDCVIAAQAFHWFDAPVALEEIHRVLVDGGGLGLVWNERDESVDWVASLGRAMRWPEHQPYVVGMDFSPIIAAGPFVNIERRQFAHQQIMDHDLLRRRVLSTSYIALMDDNDRAQLMGDVDDVIAALPAIVTLPYVTDVYRATAILR
jgi:SAM-dependent methyltransferase